VKISYPILMMIVTFNALHLDGSFMDTFDLISIVMLILIVASLPVVALVDYISISFMLKV
jgi:hypothetical protein